MTKVFKKDFYSDRSFLWWVARTVIPAAVIVLMIIAYNHIPPSWYLQEKDTTKNKNSALKPIPLQTHVVSRDKHYHPTVNHVSNPVADPSKQEAVINSLIRDTAAYLETISRLTDSLQRCNAGSGKKDTVNEKRKHLVVHHRRIRHTSKYYSYDKNVTYVGYDTHPRYNRPKQEDCCETPVCDCP